jgi:hypothetical protein
MSTFCIQDVKLIKFDHNPCSNEDFRNREIKRRETAAESVSARAAGRHLRAHRWKLAGHRRLASGGRLRRRTGGSSWTGATSARSSGRLEAAIGRTRRAERPRSRAAVRASASRRSGRRAGQARGVREPARRLAERRSSSTVLMT